MRSGSLRTMVDSRPFGTTPDGMAVMLFRLAGADGIEACISTYGATLQRLRAPDRNGTLGDVVLGFSTLEGYLTHADAYLGVTVGRYANRVAGARFVLDGVEHRLSVNDGPNSLHGGRAGFGTHVWEPAAFTADTVVLRHTSPAGDMGYPGTLAVEVRYVLSGTELRIEYRATTDAPTVVNLTNHTLWNLGGEGAGPVDGHVLTLSASRYLPVDDSLVPTGELAAVEGTPFDFTVPTAVGARLREPHPQLLAARGYDHTFVLDHDRPAGTPAARLEDPHTGRVLDIETTEPGIQVYTGNFLDGSFAGRGGRTYRQSEGIALETQHFPDAPNQPAFPSVVLRPGETFTSTTAYRLTLG